MVWDEARLAVERINGTHATEAILIQSAIASALSKDAARDFKKTISKLNDNGN